MWISLTLVLDFPPKSDSREQSYWGFVFLQVTPNIDLGNLVHSLDSSQVKLEEN